MQCQLGPQIQQELCLGALMALLFVARSPKWSPMECSTLSRVVSTTSWQACRGRDTNSARPATELPTNETQS